jgi:hypothetical protein
VRVITDFFPSPKELALKDQTLKVTIAFRKTRAAFFKLSHGAKFQAATWKELAALDRLDDAGDTPPHAIDLPGCWRL